MIYWKKNKIVFSYFIPIITSSLLSLIGCSNIEETENQPNIASVEKPIAVDVGIANLNNSTDITEYIGTTKPVQEISLRSQVEGKLLALNGNVGDRLITGQLLATIDDSLLMAAVNEAEAELTALESELAQAKAEVNNAETQLKRNEAELTQAENNAARYTTLLKDGAISQQEAENFQTIAQIARKNLLSAQEQIQIEKQAVTALIARITAQQAVISQEKARLSYSRLFSPINGIVLEKMTEVGNLITPAMELLKLGDFSQIKILVPVSELELPNLTLGQSVEIKLDAFPDLTFTGKLITIAPIVDQNNRKLNIEIILDNPDNRIGSGLLARIKIQSQQSQKIIIPETALTQKENNNYLFIIENQQEDKAQVKQKSVVVGNIVNGKVEINSGLQPGDRFVINSSKPLKDADEVVLSILSESLK